MTHLIQRARAIPSWGVVALALLLLTALLWLPFGLNIGFTGDDWIYFHQADNGIAMSSATPVRLFLPIPWIIAYALVPGHFAGINLFLALLIFLKALLVYAILRRLSAPTALAFAAAALSLVLPADTGIFYMGALAIHFAVLCYLLALYLLIVYWQKPRISALLGMFIALLGCVGIYELVYPLVLFSPLVLLLWRRKITRRWIGVSLLWYLVPLLNGIWYAAIVINFPRAFQYQSGLVSSFSLAPILGSVVNIYKRHFLDSWIAPSASSYLIVSVMAGLIVLGACLWLDRRERLEIRPRLLPLLALGGLAFIGLGVALYLPTSVRDETIRTFYFSSIGAALTLAVVFWWISRRPLIFALLVGLFAALGMQQLLDQHARFGDESKRQQSAYTELARSLPDPVSNSGIVVVDETPGQEFAKLIHNPFYLEYTLPTFYGDYSLEAEVCLPGDFGAADTARCRFSDDGLTVPSLRTRTFTRSYSQLIFMRYDGAFSVVSDLTPYIGHAVAAYQPEKLYQPNGALSAHVTALFGG